MRVWLVEYRPIGQARWRIDWGIEVCFMRAEASALAKQYNAASKTVKYRVMPYQRVEPKRRKP